MTEPLVSEVRIMALARTAFHDDADLADIADAIRTAVREAGEAAAKVCQEKIDYAMPIPCPDGIEGCLVIHPVPARRARNANECAEEIRRRLP